MLFRCIPSVVRSSRGQWANFAFAALLLAFSLGITRSPSWASDFTFVQISDTHLNGDETPGSHAAIFHDELREIAALHPTPAFIVDTGDITENGTEAQFASFQRLVASDLPKNLPVYLTAGNHDVRWSPPAGDVFQKESGQPRFKSFDYQDVHFVLLDSTVPLEHWGHIDQQQLDWLDADLKKVGHRRPVIIGFHHWIGRDASAAVMVDNEDAFLTLIAPYNVRLLLLGHGHANLLWNVNGIPAIMTGALFDGNYSLIHISGNQLEIFRRTKANPQPNKPFLTVPLQRPASPKLVAKAVAKDGQLTVTLDRTDIPRDSKVTCRVDDSKAVAIDPIDNLTVGWSGSLPLGGVVPGVHRILVTVTYSDGRIYRAPLSLTLSGLATVNPKWVVDLGSAVQGAAACDGQFVYVPTMGGTLFTLDSQTGNTVRKFTTNGCLFSAPAIDGDKLYFGSGDGNVYAIDRRTNQQLWKKSFDAPVLSGLTLCAGILCVAGSDGHIAGLDATNGKVKWTAEAGGMFQSRPATDGTHFFLGDWSNGFRSLDAQTGKLAWKITIGRSFYYSAAIGAPTLNADKTLVYVSSDDGVLHALDTKTGVERWKVNGPALGYSGPLFAKGSIYNASLTDTGRVFAFDATNGALEWEGETGSVIYDSSCCEAGPDICVGSVDGTFTAFSGQSGAIMYQYRLGTGHLLASPTAGAGSVYIGNLSGKFFAFPARSNAL